MMTDTRASAPKVRTAARWALAALLITAGVGHLVMPDEFLAQVPPWLPGWLPDPETIVLVSGLVEIVLGAALALLARHRVLVGWLVAALFVVVFPGNVSQAVTGTDAFGLDTPTARWVRLAFQPLLIVWALWSTEAWCWLRNARMARSRPSPGSSVDRPPDG